jgi:hypothetical protein
MFLESTVAGTETDSLTATCGPILYTMLNPQYFTTLWASKVCYGDSFTFICRWCETYLRASTVCYGDSYIFYMEMMFVRHRKHILASTACYGDNFTFLYVDDVLTSQETHMELHGL